MLHRRGEDKKKHCCSAEDKSSSSRIQILRHLEEEQPAMRNAQVIAKKIQFLAGPKIDTIYTSPTHSSGGRAQPKQKD